MAKNVYRLTFVGLLLFRTFLPKGNREANEMRQRFLILPYKLIYS